MKTHTCGYKIVFDNELSGDAGTYYVTAEVKAQFDGNVDLQAIEVTRCEIEADEGKYLKYEIDGGQFEKIVVKGHPVLTEAIERAIDAEIQTFAEDNCRFIGLDVAEDYEMARAEWFRD
jgi:hypothetical protein